MKLLQVIGVSEVNTHFPLFYALGHEESNDFMDWSINSMNTLRTRFNIPTPNVYITDYSAAARHGLGRYFPSSERQICMWHVQNNVCQYIKENWEGPRTLATVLDPAPPKAPMWVVDADAPDPEDESYKLNEALFTQTPTGMALMWDAICYHPSTCERERLVKNFNAKYGPTQPQIVAYLVKWYFPHIHEFAVSSTSHYLNYGFIATSMAESAHAELRHILPKVATLLQVFNASHALVVKKKAQYEVKVAFDAHAARNEYRRNPLITAIAERVSEKALEMIHNQSLWARENLVGVADFLQGVCTKRLRWQWGLPCAHELARRMTFEYDEAEGRRVLRVTQPLQLSDIDPQWHLQEGARKLYSGSYDRILEERKNTKPIEIAPPRSQAGPSVPRRPQGSQGQMPEAS